MTLVPRKPLSLAKFLIFGLLSSIFLMTSLALGPAAQAEEEDGGQSQLDSNLVISGVLIADGVRLPGVEVQVIGSGIDQTVASDEQGKWSVSVPAKDDYKIVLNLSTLPDGVALADQASSTLEVKKEDWLTSTATRNFRFEGSAVATLSTADKILQRVVAGLIFGSLLALASVGLSLIFGTTGLSNFAHGEAVTLGGITAWIAGSLMGLPIFIVIPLGLIVGGLSGFLQNQFLWAPLRSRGTKLVQMMIVSIGLSIVLRYVYLFFIDGTNKSYTGGLSGVIVLGPIRLTQGSVLTFVLAIVVLLAFAWFLTKTRVGRATRAVSDNISLAEASGIDSEKIIKIVWIAGSSLAALGGILLALYRQVSWAMGFEILLLIFAAVVLGGLGSAYGALLGSFIVGILVELSALVLPPDLKYASALFLMILVLIFRPQGVLGKKQRVG
jgi:branched-chain amino acid transport system permease protein